METCVSVVGSLPITTLLSPDVHIVPHTYSSWLHHSVVGAKEWCWEPFVSLPVDLVVHAIGRECLYGLWTGALPCLLVYGGHLAPGGEEQQG